MGDRHRVEIRAHQPVEQHDGIRTPPSRSGDRLPFANSAWPTALPRTSGTTPKGVNFAGLVGVQFRESVDKRRQFREQIRFEAGERFEQGERNAAIAKDLRVSERWVERRTG